MKKERDRKRRGKERGLVERDRGKGKTKRVAAKRWTKHWRGGEVNAPRGNATRAKQYGALRQRVHSTALYGAPFLLLSFSPVATILYNTHMRQCCFGRVSMRKVIVRDASVDRTLSSTSNRTFKFESICMFVFSREKLLIHEMTLI